jgi:phosphate transport system permease protein
MSEAIAARHPSLTDQAVRARLRKRYAAERRFRWYCRLAVAFAVGFLLLLFSDIIRKGWTAFVQSAVRFEVFLDPEVIDPTGARDPDQLAYADYAQLWREPLRETFEVEGRQERREL